MIGVLFFTFFMSVPSIILTGYEWLVFLIGKQISSYRDTLGPIYGIFEVMQFVNLVFVISRSISEKIDFDSKPWYQQIYVWAAILIAVSGIGFTVSCFYDIGFSQSKDMLHLSKKAV